MIYPALLAVGTVACGWMWWRTLHAPDHPSRRPFLATAFFGAGWTLSGLLVALAPTPDWLLFWTNLTPLVIVPTYWFTMVFILSHIGALPRRWNGAVYAGIAVWTAFLLATHQVPSLRWLFADYSVDTTADGFVLVRQTGLIHGAVVVFNLAAYLAVTALVVRSVIRSAGVHRRQSIGMLIGTLVPFATYVAQGFLLDMIDPRVDPMVLTFVPGCMLFFWLTVRQHLLTVAPIPRHSLMDAIPDAILVVDTTGRILEANRAAAGLGGLAADPIGGRLADAPDIHAALTPHLAGGAVEADVRLATAAGGDPRDFALAVTPYQRDGRPAGRMLMFRDVTERSRLQTCLHRTLAELREKLEENLRLQEQLREQAIRDQLTNLYNRYHCNAVHPVLMADCRARGRPMSVVLMDVDHFKAVNDELGHAAGDGVLRVLSEVLRSHPVEGASVYRYGGEEFLALLPDLGADEAVAVADRWRTAFLDETRTHPTIRRPVNFSAGVSVFPYDAEDWPALVNDADIALYTAKAAGRGRTCVWTAEGPVEAAERSRHGTRAGPRSAEVQPSRMKA